jgi:hypothetical protein
LIFIEAEVAIIIASLSESNKFGEDSPVSLPTVSKDSNGKINCVGAYVGTLYLVGILVLIGFNVGDNVGLFVVGKYVGDNVGIFVVGNNVGVNVFEESNIFDCKDQDIIFEYVDFDN